MRGTPAISSFPRKRESMNTGLGPWSDGLSQWMPAFAGMTVLLALFLSLAAPARANVPQPVVPKAEGQCIDVPHIMRRNHMDMLKHTRDDTMRLGIRPAKQGLKDCVSCHAVPGVDGKPVGIAEPKHFCRTCQSYGGVEPDCFQCHSSVPEAGP